MESGGGFAAILSLSGACYCSSCTPSQYFVLVGWQKVRDLTIIFV